MNKRITLAALAGLSTLFAILLILGFLLTINQQASRVPPMPGSSAQEVIENRLELLPLGEVYHNVPDQMQAGVQEIIEAGITPKITKQIREKIRGKGKVTTKAGIRFDPSGVDMKLVADSEEFKVSPIKGGKQFVTPNNTPDNF